MPALATSPNKEQVAVSTVSKIKTIATPLKDSSQTKSFEGEVTAITERGQALVLEQGKLFSVDLKTFRRSPECTLNGKRAFRTIACGQSNDFLILMDSGMLFHYLGDQNRVVGLVSPAINVRAVAYQSQNKTAYAGTRDGQLLQIDLADYRTKTLVELGASIKFLDLSTKENQLLIALEDKRLIVWDCAESRQVSSIKTQTSLSEACFTFDNDHAVGHNSLQSSEAFLWNLHSGQTISKMPPIKFLMPK